MGYKSGVTPHPGTIDNFEQRIFPTHSRIVSFDKISYAYYVINRDRFDSLRVFLSDQYTLGIDAYLAIRSEYSEADCIVCASGYDSYTSDAKARAIEDKIGLFTLKEFMGAIHRRDFWNYESPKDESPSATKPRRVS